MANEKYVAGHSRTLARWDGEAYKPQVCLSSIAFQSTMNMLEKVNMCTAGQTIQSPSSMTRSVQLEGEVIDTTAVGGQTVEDSLEELYEVQDVEFTTKTPDLWRLSDGPFGYKYFYGFISDLSDNYQASEDATFSATLTVNDKPTTVDPNTP